MHDLKFQRLFDIDWDDPVESDFQSATAKAAVRVFNKNAQRALNIAVAPGFAAVMSSKLTNSICIIGQFCPDLSNSTERQAEVDKHFMKSMKIPMSEFMNQVKVHSAWHESLLNGFPWVHSAFEDAMRSMVISMHGTLEILWAELYRGAKGEVPAAKQADFTDDRFATRRWTRCAYIKAFKDHGLKQHLEAPIVNAICLLRNVIVHNAGVADEEFCKGIATTKSYDIPLPDLDCYKSLPEGQPVNLDGDLVCNILNKAGEWGKELLFKVDGWILQNK